jgi:MFS transporter, FSR family, fosmidomycin resistance protein
LNTLKLTTYLSVYGFAHAVVDASCMLLIFGGLDVKGDLLTYIILYNTLAFGMQMPFGFILDKLHSPNISAMIGCILLIIALMFPYHPLMAISLAGIGNALFHVGGGTISLNLKPGKAFIPGVFVAPGGIGLFAGLLISKYYGFPYKIFIILLFTVTILIYFLKKPAISYSTQKEKPIDYFLLTVFLVLITVCIRSLVGLSVHFPWKSDISLLVLLTISIALGKGIGGLIADYFGWIRVSVGCLVISALLIFWGPTYPLLGILGMFLFNFTMPVTLVTISNMLPGKPGFSFGLTTLAILLGVVPSYVSPSLFPIKDVILLLLTLISAVCLWIGLTFYFRNLRK